MDDTQKESPTQNLALFCGAPIAIALLIGGIAGATAFLGDDTKDQARAACVQLATIGGGELEDAKTEHISADMYRITGTVEAPGLPDEAFNGVASKDGSGDYTCRMD